MSSSDTLVVMMVLGSDTEVDVVLSWSCYAFL